MKTSVINFRGKRTEISYQDSIRGIMLSYLGTDTNMIDDITIDERNDIINQIMNL